VAAVGRKLSDISDFRVYGARGKNFFENNSQLAAERPELRIVERSGGAPTWSRDLADATRKIIEQLAAKILIGKDLDS